ncbi:MAG: gliding motility-associated C-terminal domain-containing protein, partial [Bacteroidia bacterium]|nr:gliding motility-associated C-terminal domain-containing protein [Bacteroidia bacterium]
ACSETQVMIRFTDPDCINIPNLITPNGDGINDYFDIPCASEHPGSTLVIYNRWGDEVFYTDDFNIKWIGRYRNEDLPVGTYYYVAKINNPEQTVLHGYIYLQR